MKKQNYKQYQIIIKQKGEIIENLIVYSKGEMLDMCTHINPEFQIIIKELKPYEKTNK